jgi:hypothetical protein
MKKLVLLFAVVFAVVNTSLANDGVKKLKKHRRARYHQCDAYKTQYAPIKPDHHKRHHHTCDAYN